MRIEAANARTLLALEEQRATVAVELGAIDAHRAALERKFRTIRGILASYREMLANGNGGAGSFVELPPDFFAGKGIVEATRIFLRMTGIPQPHRTVVKALQDGGIESSSKHFTDTVRNLLTRNANKQGELIWQEGKWSLREWELFDDLQARLDAAGVRKSSPESAAARD